MPARTNDAIRNLREALALLETVDSGAAICHVQLAIDLIEADIRARLASLP